MARAALGWRAKDLSDAAGIGTATIARFELGSDIASESRDKMRSAFEGAGVRFVDRGAYRGAVCPPEERAGDGEREDGNGK
jgi:hypothetical protein